MAVLEIDVIVITMFIVPLTKYIKKKKVVSIKSSITAGG
jgi:hypothetical protein